MATQQQSQRMSMDTLEDIDAEIILLVERFNTYKEEYSKLCSIKTTNNNITNKLQDDAVVSAARLWNQYATEHVDGAILSGKTMVKDVQVGKLLYALRYAKKRNRLIAVSRYDYIMKNMPNTPAAIFISSELSKTRNKQEKNNKKTTKTVQVVHIPPLSPVKRRRLGDDFTISLKKHLKYLKLNIITLQ